jgi:hypothetical protein
MSLAVDNAYMTLISLTAKNINAKKRRNTENRIQESELNG